MKNLIKTSLLLGAMAMNMAYAMEHNHIKDDHYSDGSSSITSTMEDYSSASDSPRLSSSSASSGIEENVQYASSDELYDFVRDCLKYSDFKGMNIDVGNFLQTTMCKHNVQKSQLLGINDDLENADPTLIEAVLKLEK